MVALTLLRPSLQQGAMPTLSPRLVPILLLIGSNVFMTFAW